MQIELIKRIRKALNINPQSKSTLVKKQDMLRYAQKIYHQNLQLKDILEPSINYQFMDTERRVQELNISLLSYETELKREKQRNQILQSSVRCYREYLQKKRKLVKDHEEKIKQLDQLNMDDKKMELQSFEHILMQNMQRQELGEGENAMMKLMKQFLTFQKEKAQKLSQFQ